MKNELGKRQKFLLGTHVAISWGNIMRLYYSGYKISYLKHSWKNIIYDMKLIFTTSWAGLQIGNIFHPRQAEESYKDALRTRKCNFPSAYQNICALGWSTIQTCTKGGEGGVVLGGTCIRTLYTAPLATLIFKRKRIL